MSEGGWKAVDASLIVLAGRNPNFRVVFKGYFGGDFNYLHRVVTSLYFPLASSKGIVVLKQAFNVENRLLELGICGYPLLA